jgi:hypothetical protein
MSVLAPTDPLGADVNAHLDAQLDSARRLLDLTLRQGVAIRAQQVDEVLARLSDIQVEMELRGQLEQQRTVLLNRAGAQLGVPGHAITLDAMASLMAPAEGAGARGRSAELRGLLAEIQREHTVNRALMRQELAFLDHLTRMMSGQEDLGYRRPGDDGGSLRVSAATPTVHRVLDLEA